MRKYKQVGSQPEESMEAIHPPFEALKYGEEFKATPIKNAATLEHQIKLLRRIPLLIGIIKPPRNIFPTFRILNSDIPGLLNFKTDSFNLHPSWFYTQWENSG